MSDYYHVIHKIKVVETDIPDQNISNHQESDSQFDDSRFRLVTGVIRPPCRWVDEVFRVATTRAAYRRRWDLGDEG